jgi:hypothetical protein
MQYWGTIVSKISKKKKRGAPSGFEPYSIFLKKLRGYFYFSVLIWFFFYQACQVKHALFAVDCTPILHGSLEFMPYISRFYTLT